MKKTLTVMALVVGTVAGYSQGEIQFLAGGSAATGFKQVIYSQSTANTEVSVTYNGYTVLEQQGSTSATPETPTGTTVYGGSLLTGSGYDAELLGAAGFNDSLQSLSPLQLAAGGPAILNFYTGGTASGTISGSLAVVAESAGGGPTTIAIAAWNNEGGTVTSLAAAQSAGDPWGISATSDITSIAAPSNPALMSTGSDLNLSFSLGQATPEPSTIALGVMGVSALLFRRRK